MSDIKSKIDLAKSEKGEERVEKIRKADSDKKSTGAEINEMQSRIRGFCEKLSNDEQSFDKEDTFDYLVQYIHDCHRILYSEFSNHIYVYYDEHDSEDASQTVGTMISHAEELLSYTKTEAFEQKMEKADNKKNYEDAQKAIVKIWDHMSLAQQQYSMLKQSDAEYNEKIDKRLIPFQRKLSKEMNAQLLTMIGIFTALAFLLFGGISSLENLFANSSMPMLKFMVVGSIWGLCLLNLLYIFLFCVGKMANLTIAPEQQGLTVFQRYAIVWWSDFILVSIMILSLWGYYLKIKNSYEWFDNIFVKHSSVFTIIILISIVKVGCMLIKVTKKKEETPIIK